MNNDKIDVCYLCGKTSEVTDDHIPPHSLSPKSPRSMFFFAPACEECNNKYSHEESKFRDFLAAASAGFGNESASDAYFASRRNFQRNQAANFILGKDNKDLVRIINSFKIIDVRTPGGILLGKAPAISPPQDLDYKLVLSKIARGLHYIGKKRVIPNDYVCEATFIKELIFPELLKDCNFVGLCPDFFSFKGGFTKDDPNVSVWYMSFYKRVAAFVAFYPPSFAERLEDTKSKR